GSLSYSVKKLKVIAGGGWNVYRGRHFGKVIWAEFADNLPYDYRYYLSHSYKRDANAYIKGEFTASKKLNIFGDVQIRSVKYSGNATDQDNVIIDFGKTYLFFNPKGGVSYSVNSKNILYGSLSIANREPVRGDFVDNKLSSLPKPEHLTDIEIGYKFRGRAMFFNANAYLMSYKDQLVVTGELNDVGSSIRRNVNKSYRAGIEFIASAEILKNLRWDGNLTFSDNRIKQFDEVLFNYDSGRSEINIYKNVQIAFSPGVIAYSGFTYSVRSFGITFMSKYVGRQYLDNTGHESRSLPSYFVNDVRLDYTPKIFGIKKLKATLLVNNVFSTLYSSNGYTYSYIYGKTITENFYYPQAKINFLAALSLSF
ncbi:MAG: TonB-dependent receptor, partial [Bacteroidia bacterium]|nr:TonB-dependent receptor [Bacteroidia bacterium]